MADRKKNIRRPKRLDDSQLLYEKIGKRLKSLRLAAGYTAAEQFAYEHDFGRSQFEIINWPSGLFLSTHFTTKKQKIMSTQKIQFWASEINKDWAPGFKAAENENSLIVTFNSEEIARIDYNNGRYTVTGIDKNAVEELEYMVNR